MTTERRECKDRETDKFSYKLTQAAGLITAVSIIGGAILYVGSMFFQSIDAAQIVETKHTIQIRELELKQNQVDNTLIEYRTDIKYIKEALTELKQKIK